MAQHPISRAKGERRVTTSRPWWQRAVFYENHLPTFRDGNGDGVGDLLGLTESLDYLSETLGVGAVWIGPCFRSPMLDEGFDIADYLDIAPVFGDLAVFDKLVSEAHAHGVRVIADYVPNHTSDQHPWFRASRSSRDDPFRDWYVWRDARPDGSPPTNWLSEAGGSVWQWDEPTGQYYLHSYLKEMPDLNWRNPAVREAMFDVLRFWLDRGVDGFRIDVAHLLMKDPEFRDNPPLVTPADNLYDIFHRDFGSQLHVYDGGHPDVHAVLKQVRAVVDEYPDRVLVGEIAAMDWAGWAAYFGDSLDEIHLPFAFRLIETPWTARDLAREVEQMLRHLPDGARPILALGNHDRPRLATRIGRSQAAAAAILLMTLPGVPIVFYGDELGLQDQPVPRDRQRDTFAFTDGGVSRDPVRTPMPWAARRRNGGFSEAEESHLWLPVSRLLGQIDVETQLAAPDSLLNLYRALIAERQANTALLDGGYRLVSNQSELSGGVLIYDRVSAGEAVRVVLDVDGAGLEITLPMGSTLILSTGARPPGPLSDSLLVAPNEGLLIRLPNTDEVQAA